MHFYPGSWLPQKFRASAWGYTALLTAYIATLLERCWCWSRRRRATALLATVICGFVLPYTIWFTTFAMTAFLQHTNPQLRWYRNVASMASPPESTAVHVGIPALDEPHTHYVLEHPVHHVSAMIPHYHLKQAQTALAGMVEPHIITMPFTVGNMRDVLRRCRLYDYDAHAWLDFNGQVTAIPLDIGRKPASGLPLACTPIRWSPTSPGIFFPPEPASRDQPSRPYSLSASRGKGLAALGVAQVDFGGHAPVERAADLEPPLVALAVAGEERRLGLLARALRGGEAVLGEMAQGGVEHGVGRPRAAVVVRRQPAGLARLARAHARGDGAWRGSETDGHGAPCSRSVDALAGGLPG